MLGHEKLDIAGLRRIDSFNLHLLNIKNNFTKILIGDGEYSAEVEVAARPEPGEWS